MITPTGLFANILDRICVPGTILIATLSGFGAVNTAWEAVEWQKMSKRYCLRPIPPTSDMLICFTGRSSPTRASAVPNERFNEPVPTCKIARQISLQRRPHPRRCDRPSRMLSRIGRQTRAQTGGRSLFGRMLGTGDPNASSTPTLRPSRSSSPRPISRTELSSIRQEVAGMEAMEGQMIRDLAMLKSRKAAMDLSRTWLGKVWQAVGVGFAVYCAVRIVLVRMLADEIGPDLE